MNGPREIRTLNSFRTGDFKSPAYAVPPPAHIIICPLSPTLSLTSLHLLFVIAFKAFLTSSTNLRFSSSVISSKFLSIIASISSCIVSRHMILHSTIIFCRDASDRTRSCEVGNRRVNNSHYAPICGGYRIRTCAPFRMTFD